MRNALLLLSLWLGILVAAYGLVYWDRGIERPLPISVLEQEGRIATVRYVHPDGVFAVPIPTEWKVEEAETAVRLVAPAGDTEVWLLRIEGDDPEAALGAAWTLVAPDLLVDPVSVEELAPWDDVEQSLKAEYGGEATDERIYGVAHLSDGKVTVLLVRGSLEAVEAYADELTEIEEGLTVSVDDAMLL